MLVSWWLHDHCVGRRPLTWWLPVVMLLWSNTHPGIITGQGLLAGAIGWEWLNRWLKFNPPLEYAAGQWRTISNVMGWTCTAGAQVLRGLYVTAGDELVLSRAFDAPVTIDAGNPYFTTIEVWDWARVTLPC